jgi:hypothetical protein
MKFGSLILISFPSNAQINSRKIERDRDRGTETEKQEIELGKEKLKMLDDFKINCICSSIGELEF